ncbi:MAG: cohesin domain-containing protein [Bacteroidales bacterium]|nr:cohesin domain-containing protein [Bacteroidales bacterium]
MLKKILQLVVVLLIAAPGVMAQTVQIDSVVEPPGAIRVQVDMLNYTDVAAITLYIGFDSDLMDFTSIDSTQLTGSWLANYNSSIDKVVVTYTATPTGSGYAINGKAFDLLFDYKGGFSTDLTLDTNMSEIANSSLAGIPTTYIDGFVEQTASLGTLSLDDLIDTVGNTVTMPLSMEGAGFDSVAGLTFKIGFDPFQLSYSGIVEDALTGVTASASGGMLTITWSGSGSTMDFTSLTHLLDIQFVYNGGEADVMFRPGCEIIDNNLVPVAFDYTNGTVTAIAGTATLDISDVGIAPGSAVNIPVVASDFGAEIVGSITMNIDYDASLLVYTGYTAQQLSGWVVNNNNPGELSFQWSGSSTLADGDLVTLNFNYDSAGGQADITFQPGTILKDVGFTTIPVNYLHGSVSSYTVSGMLSYMGDASRPIATAGSSTSTVYLKNVADSSIAYTTAADANGDYTFNNIAAGSYFLDATTTIDATWAYDVTDAFIINGIGGTLTGLQALAADVNEDGSADASDAFIVYGSVVAGNVKVSSWTAPDWFFENPSVTVNTDVTQNFSAICSGDANGDFVPIY